MDSLERAWAEIDLDALAYNFKQVQNQVGAREVYAVIKADAYGHGAPQAAKALAGAGATRFAVATAQEALQLRRHGFAQPILLLGATSSQWAVALARENITLAVPDFATAQGYAAALTAQNLAAKIHIKCDTGMGRLGFDGGSMDAAAALIVEVAALPCFEVEGLFTHFAVADEREGTEYTARQFQRFCQLADLLQDKGLRLPLTHCANSAAIIAHPDKWRQAVRPGIMLYGSNPCEQMGFDLKPVMTLRTRIAQLKTVKKGQTISYGRTWTAPRDTLVATLTIGYADGLLRNLSGKLEMIVDGHKAPQIGRICMDMCMLDVTGVPGVQVGDAATIFGQDGGQSISADAVADAAGTISYEIFCAVGRRVPRFYKQDGVFTREICYVDQL